MHGEQGTLQSTTTIILCLEQRERKGKERKMIKKEMTEKVKQKLGEKLDFSLNSFPSLFLRTEQGTDFFEIFSSFLRFFFFP